jgi:hypothetical protein
MLSMPSCAFQDLRRVHPHPEQITEDMQASVLWYNQNVQQASPERLPVGYSMEGVFSIDPDTALAGPLLGDEPAQEGEAPPVEAPQL